MTHPPFRFFVLNAEDLFVYLDREPPADLSVLTELEWQRLSASTVENKPLRKLFELSKLIELEDPDVMVLSEVGGVESLRNFNRLFLRSKYTVHLLPGNSKRGIDVGFLVRSTLPFQVHLRTNRERPLNFLYPHEIVSKNLGYPIPAESHQFSRDVAELHLHEVGNPIPRLIFFGVHLKSRLDPDGIDPGGRDRREAEVKALVEIYNERRREFPHTPILIGGDFNGQVFEDGGTEFKVLFEHTDLQDVMEAVGIPREQRFTHVFIDSNAKVIARALDFIFTSKDFMHLLKKDSTRILDFVDARGVVLSSPTTLEERFLQPSDHRALRLDFILGST